MLSTTRCSEHEPACNGVQRININQTAPLRSLITSHSVISPCGQLNTIAPCRGRSKPNRNPDKKSAVYSSCLVLRDINKYLGARKSCDTHAWLSYHFTLTILQFVETPTLMLLYWYFHHNNAANLQSVTSEGGPSAEKKKKPVPVRSTAAT